MFLFCSFFCSVPWAVLRHGHTREFPQLAQQSNSGLLRRSVTPDNLLLQQVLQRTSPFTDSYGQS